MRMPWEAFAQMLKMYEIVDHLAECILSTIGGIWTIRRYNCQMKKQMGRNFRAYLLARRAALHVVKNHFIMRSLIKQHRLSKSDFTGRRAVAAVDEVNAARNNCGFVVNLIEIM